MHITIINDCKDANVVGRQLARVASLLNTNATFVGISNELEASGNIIDILDASQESEGIILVNVAPRNGKAKQHSNGTPFGYFWHKKILIVSSVDGLTLSLVKKLKITEHINVLNIPKSLDVLIEKGALKYNLKDHITNSQFRSYEFLPRIGAFIFKHQNIESEKMDIANIADAPAAIWWIDNFGNCKTTIFAEELGLKNKDIIKTKAGKLTYYTRLKDVPNALSAIITGSSGLGEKRFLEIVIQGKSAEKKYRLHSGDIVF